MMSNKQPTLTQLPIETQREIKKRYMEGYSGTELANTYNLIPQSLNWYIREHNWKEERRLARAELFQAFSDTKKAAFTSIYMNSTSFLKKAIDDAIEDYKSKDLSASERLKIAKMVSEIITSLDKIQRLDDGTPTEIREDKVFEPIELKKLLDADPFQEDIPDANYKELDSDTEHN